MHVFKNHNIENETNYRGKRILDKHISHKVLKKYLQHIISNGIQIRDKFATFKIRKIGKNIANKQTK